MTFPLVQLVSAPAEDADVLFDFNDGAWADDETWPEHDGFTTGAPTLEGEPGAYGAEDGLRTFAFNLIMRATAQDAATRMSALARAVRRRTGWLRFQASEFSPPMWFRTYRTAQGALDFELVRNTADVQVQLWGIGVSINADPYGYGERVTLGPYTINNDPAAVTNPCMVTLPEIAGDVPAPLRVDMVASSQQLNQPALMFAVAPVPGDFAGPIVLQIGAGDVNTAGTDTNAGVAAASYSGGSCRNVTFATREDMVNRLTLPVSGIRPGRYSVLLRVGRSDASSTFVFRAGLGGRQVAFDPGAASTDVGFAQWLDLGAATFPTGLTDFSLASMVATSFVLYASRASGTGSARLDAVVLVPTELLEDEVGAQLATSLYYFQTGSVVTRFDGDTESVQVLSSSGSARAWPVMPAPLRGGFPSAAPGRMNVLHLFRGVAGTGPDAADDITFTTTVTVSYQPRWLWLAAS